MEQRVDHRRFVLLCSLVIGLPYLVSSFIMEPFWATHQLWTLPTIISFLFLAASALMITLPYWMHTDDSFLRGDLRVPIWLFALAGGLLFYGFPPALDTVGDAHFIYDDVNFEIPSWDIRLITEPLEPDWFHSKVGLFTYFQIVNFFTWLFGTKGIHVSPVVNAVLGGLYIIFWLLLVRKLFENSGWRQLFSVVGLCTPLMMVFMWHYETYCMSYTAIMGWFLALAAYFKSGSRKILFVLPILFLVVLQTHITNWLLLPSLVIAFVWHYKGKLQKMLTAMDSVTKWFVKGHSRALEWSGVLIYMGVPFVLVLLVTYFFIFQNFDGPRRFFDPHFDDALFLPLYTIEAPPLDRYNLFGLAHINDYFNLAYIWSAGALLLLVLALTRYRNAIHWNDPFVITTGFTALVFHIVFFMLNPLLSMAIDWDLFSTPGIVTFAFLAASFSTVKTRKVGPLAGPAIGMSLLSFVFIIMCLFPVPMSKHLDTAMRYSYKTYWMGSSTGLFDAANLQPTEVGRLTMLQDQVEKLRPYAILGNDDEFAALLSRQGSIARDQNNPDSAIVYLEEAHAYSPRLMINLYRMALVYFELGAFQESYEAIAQLVSFKYEPYERTLRIALHISLAAGQYQSAANYAVTYRNRWPDNPVVNEIEERLRSGDNIEQLVDLFQTVPDQ